VTSSDSTSRPSEDEAAPRGTDDETLYDEYVELALEGAPPTPDEFLASRGASSRELRAALEEVFRRAPRGQIDAAPPWKTLGDHRLIERIGGGGMGVVFLAEQRALGRKVALKVLRPELSGSAVAAERFRREARAVAQLRHPNIVTLYAAGEEHGVRYLAMEFVEGASLADMLASGEIAATPISQRVRWVAQIARALDFAHRNGVIHRDVKPSNIRIAAPERALLLDFGLARTSDSVDATLTDSFAGSPKYASPEQIAKSSSVDARSDVYSLGVTLYQLIAGRAPFDGDSVERLFHQILAGDVTPLRKLAPRAPRDLETVVHKALERRPEQRYSSAAEFADDLEAVLEFRPIRGRPPGLVERARRAAKRNPALAAGVASGVLAAAVFALLWLGKTRSEREDARERAREEVRAARASIDEYRASRAAIDGVQRALRELTVEQNAKHLSEEEYALLDDNEDRLARLQREWTATYFRVLDRLQNAERLDPGVAEVEAVRAELHMERLRQALAEHDRTGVEVYRELVREHDREGRFARELDGALSVSLATDPPGAEVYAFRYEELSRLQPRADARTAPAPLGANSNAPPPGTWCLRMLAPHGEALRDDLIVELDGRPLEGVVLALTGHGDVRAGDRLVEFDERAVDDVWRTEGALPMTTPTLRDDATGYADTWIFERNGERFEVRSTTAEELGVELGSPWEYAVDARRPPARCRAWRNGEFVTYLLEPGAPARPTARPLFTSAACSIGRTPLDAATFPLGDYLLVARLDGYEELRVSISEQTRSFEGRWALLPNGSTPEGWVQLAHADTPREFVWIGEHEVTSGEYLEFLNDPATRREIDASTTLIRQPREGGGNPRPHWLRRADGSFSPPSHWRLDWPIVGVSFEDARAYVAWRNLRAQRTGDPFEYALPTLSDIYAAGVGSFRWSYTYGDRFRAKFSRCCFARPNAHVGPVLRFPIDESPFGVFDLTGGAFEWIEGWYDEPRAQRHMVGGAWGQAHPDVLRIDGGLGALERGSTGETGLRLVRRRAKSGR